MAIDVLKGFIYLVVMYISALLIVLTIRKLRIIPTEIIRKTFHITCAMSVYLLMYTSRSWLIATLVALSFIVVVYPILTLLEHTGIYKRFLNERSKGEVKSSLILAYLMMIILFVVYWGWGGPLWKAVVPISIMAWGYGDAAAALIGKRFGRNFINVPGVDKRKTVEGTFAMAVVSALAIFFTSWAYAVLPWFLCLLLAVLVSPICAGVELVSHRGIDTLTVPLSAATAISLVILSIQSFGG